ncbi:MAG: DUF1294 domain-containing protein [Coriobacteriia bacterium]|nr:DUF1294 domain-containing protein [Coriobacteriia bacterium]MBN2822303.1 DUF1294 domain-containing protein [Coriobacteriia bacterium]
MMISSAVFLLLLVMAAFGTIPWCVLLVYVVMSVVTFVAYARDKRAAQRGQWRTGEGTLILLGVLGGWPGALIAQKTLRHKTRKQPFRTVFWASVTINIGLLTVLIIRA